MFLLKLVAGSSAARICRFLTSIALLGMVTIVSSPAHAGDWPPVDIGPATARVEDALKDPTTLEFIETPLQDVVDFLKDVHGIEIQIDSRALEDVGIGSDTPVTRNLKGISLRSALRLVLKELDLTYVVRDEVLLITTPEEAEQDTNGYVQVYDVEPLLDEEHGVSDLIETVSMAFGDEQKVQISTFRGLLIVKATSRQQQQVRRLLGVIGAALDVTPPKTVAQRERERPLPMDVDRPAERLEPAPDVGPFGGAAAAPFDGGADPFGG